MNRPGLQMPRALADEMIEHCRAEFPNEACGMLGEKHGKIVKVYRMTNEERSPVRYRPPDRELMAAQNHIDDQGWELGGVFHSHTRTEAYPSPTDVRLPTFDVPYVIVSLAEDPPVVRAFLIKKAKWTDPEGEIEEIPVQVIG